MLTTRALERWGEEDEEIKVILSFGTNLKPATRDLTSKQHKVLPLLANTGREP